MASGADGSRVKRLTVRGAGVDLAVQHAGPADAPAVVFVHGYPDTADVWRPVMERLAGEHHVIAYDVRGAGGSGAPRGPAAYGFEPLGADLEAVCAALAPERRVHLVGHDWGAIQGWEFATAPRFDGRLASFTTIAGPALGHAALAARGPLRAGRLLTWLDRLRRSWYIVPLCLPGGPSLAWRGVLGGRRWRETLRTVERLPVDAGYPAATVTLDGYHGANLYRRNILPLLWRRPALARARVPVLLIVPGGDRFIAPAYYDAADELAPGLRRRWVPGSHWAPRAQPEALARWIAAFVRETEAGGLSGRSRGRSSERRSMLLRHRPPRIDPRPTTPRDGFEHLDASALAVLRWLLANRVDFVLVGPLARAIRGETGTAGPAAIVPAPYERNWERLCAALVAGHAGLRADTGARGSSAGVTAMPVKLTPEKLSRGRRWLLRCGGYDIDIEAAGSHREDARAGSSDVGPRYQELLYEAGRFELADGLSVEVASPEDLEHYSHVRRTGAAPEFRVTRKAQAEHENA